MLTRGRVSAAGRDRTEPRVRTDTGSRGRLIGAPVRGAGPRTHSWRTVDDEALRRRGFGTPDVVYFTTTTFSISAWVLADAAVRFYLRARLSRPWLREGPSGAGGIGEPVGDSSSGRSALPRMRGPGQRVAPIHRTLRGRYAADHLAWLPPGAMRSARSEYWNRIVEAAGAVNVARALRRAAGHSRRRRWRDHGSAVRADLPRACQLRARKHCRRARSHRIA